MQEANVISSEEVKYPVVKVLEEPEYCKLKVHYEADPEVVVSKIDEAVAECRKLQVPGFRKGRAPDSAIKMRLRPQINQYVVREMATHAIDDIIFELNIKPIGQPKFSDIKASKNNFACDVELIKKPDFELSELEFEVPKPSQEDEDTIVEKSLYNIRCRIGGVEPYEENDVVENGDQVTFSFIATIDGEKFDGSIVDGELYTVGSNRWTGFDQNILGMKAEETKEFEFTFKDGLLAEKTANFSVTIHMGTKPKPHPIDDEFFQIIGVKSIEELLNNLRSSAKFSIDRNSKMMIRNIISNQLLEKNKFEVPKIIIEQEAQYQASRAGLAFTSLSDADREKYLEEAERNARLSLILDSVRDSEPDSVLNSMEARNAISGHIQAQGGNPELVLRNPAHAAMLLSQVKDEFTLQWVADKAKII